MVQPEMNPPTVPPPPSGAKEIADDGQTMTKRLWKSDELIKQLKQIVKAQHGKIEELRERLESEPLGMVKSHMAKQDMANFSKIKEDNEELRRQHLRSKGELEKVKHDNDTLRMANNRMKRMIKQQNGGEQTLPQLSHRDPGPQVENYDDNAFSPIRPMGMENSPGGVSFSTPRTAPILSTTARSSALGSTNPKRPTTSGSGARPGSGAGASAGLPAFSKLWRLSSVLPMFWRDLQDVASVLNSLVEISGRILEDGPSASITIYMIDPWLRTATMDTNDHQAPALFYLGTGKTTVQVFRSATARAEPPRHQDLSQLPARSRAALAVAVTTPCSHKKLAMLQILSTEESHDHKSPLKAPMEIKDRLGGHQSPDHHGFTETHLMHLQMACTVAGGILEQLKDTHAKSHLLDRMRSCFDVSVAVNQARSLPDFEQRIKTLLGDFFGVTTVRVLFYDNDTNELLISSAQMRRKGLSKLSLDKGVVGYCAKFKQVIHVSNISHHPHIDAAADGLQRSGRPISSEASMLVGPLVIENVDGARLVGVVQLLERRKEKKEVVAVGGIGKSEEFSADEQALFNQVLRVCAHVVWRTFKVQELTAQLSNTPSSLAHMLAG